MKKLSTLLFAAAVIMVPTIGQCQLEMKVQVPSNPDNEPAPVHPVPHERQILWNETEFYAFFHYGMNTYTNKEWGDGSESNDLFAPTAMPNPRQWVESVKAAGMKGGIAVVKHHDGFCLWPTATTDHRCTNSSNTYAQQLNVPQLFAEASKELGMKYGFYISPWDRNSALYGEKAYVTDVFLKQAAELAEYGDDQFEMWFDGANGGSGYYGGKNTTVNVGEASTYYDVYNLRDKVHNICKNCVMWGVGDEARWIGNEAGWAGDENWAMGYGTSGSADGWYWHPGESDAKATTSGWFWHSGQGNLSAERLFQMYLETVGRNATLILNFPPNQAGVLPDADVTILNQLGKLLKQRLGVDTPQDVTAATDYAKTATIQVSDTRTAGSNRNYETSNLTDGNSKTYWATNDGVNTATITLTWDTPKTIRYVQLMENIALGQRIRDFDIEVSTDGSTFTAKAANITSTVGYKRIIPLNASTSSSYDAGTSVKAVRISIKNSKSCPTLSNISIF